VYIPGVRWIDRLAVFKTVELEMSDARDIDYMTRDTGKSPYRPQTVGADYFYKEKGK
jgi:hypothetical protein